MEQSIESSLIKTFSKGIHWEKIPARNRRFYLGMLTENTEMYRTLVRMHNHGLIRLEAIESKMDSYRNFHGNDVRAFKITITITNQTVIDQLAMRLL